MSEDKNSPKIISDPIHGQISVHPLCVAIIDTPEFQRLRRIKQLGMGYTVYPSAIHNRFSHSLGVSHLARKFLTELLKNSKGVTIVDRIGEKEILSVEVAGLCHDLGHGPFSHVWEAFMKEAAKDRDTPDLTWNHEDLSVVMLDYLIRKNGGLQDKFDKYEVNVDDVKDLIKGERGSKGNLPRFLYQIVNNEESGLDVDKWDYYLRDCHHLGMHCSFEYERLIRFAKVMKVGDDDYQICFREKVKPMVYNMFRTRSELHHLAYQHRVVKTTEQMMIDTLVKLDNGQRNDKNASNRGSWWDITRNATSGTEKDKFLFLERFCELDDDVIYSHIRKSSEKTIIDGIEKRSEKMYRFVTQWNVSEIEGKQDIMDEIKKIIRKGKENTTGVDSEKILKDVVVQVVPIHWGKRKQNPVKHVHFYSKDDKLIPKENDNNESDEKWMQPALFQDIQVRILCRDSSKKVCDFLREVCEDCKQNFSHCKDPRMHPDQANFFCSCKKVRTIE